MNYSNFEFLFDIFKDYKNFILIAEKCWREDPHNCIIKVGILMECVIHKTALRHGYKYVNKNGHDSTDLLFKYLKKIFKNDTDILILKCVKKCILLRNCSAHHRESIHQNQEDSIMILYYSFIASLWFYIGHYNNEYIPNDFKLSNDITITNKQMFYFYNNDLGIRKLGINPITARDIIKFIK